MSRLVGGILLTVGLAITSAGGYCFFGAQDLLNNGLRSPGKIVEMQKGPTDRYYIPVVQFETPDHRTITARCKTGSNPPVHKVADSVTVIYRASSPEDFRLDEPLELWLLTWILGGIGSIFVMVGGGLLVYSIRRA